RVRKDSAGSWTEYVYFNGQPLAEKNSDGSWSDYVYAGGERLARADSYDERIHTSGTSTVAASYAAWYLPFATYVIKSGDKISWRQYQTVKGGGMGIGFSDGTNTNWTAARDTDGQEMNNDGTVGSWHNRTVDLTAFAGKTATKLWVASSTATPVGSWNIYYGDIAIHSADGTVTTIYERGPSEGFSYWTGGGETNPQAIVERTNTAGDAETPGTTTTYYVADQINSARMMLTAGGWPVSMDTYYPSGTEAYPPGDANHYKFTGKERDQESGNDYFGARYYSSAMGRFMSPDWSAKAEPVPYAKLDNPQSLNLYEYALNNPLSGVDKDGHSSDTGCGVDGKPAPCSFNDKRTNKPQQQNTVTVEHVQGHDGNPSGHAVISVDGKTSVGLDQKKASAADALEGKTTPGAVVPVDPSRKVEGTAVVPVTPDQAGKIQTFLDNAGKNPPSYNL